MSKCVYMVRDHGPKLRELLEQEGFRVIIGNGKPEREPLAQCHVLMPGGKVTVDTTLLDGAPMLELIVKSGVGHDRIDLDECTQRGIFVANTPLTNYLSVAEHTMMLMLAAAKKVYPISIYLRHEYPDFWCRERYEGFELCGKVLCVVGLGNIGRRVAELAHAFGMNILGVDPYVDPAKLPGYIRLEQNLSAALAQGDFVTLHVAGGDATRHMIGAPELAVMKNSSILINVARGSVVDEAALAAALRDGTIAGAGLDVFEQEPLQAHNPLMLLENVVATPHCAGNTTDARLRTQLDCMENIRDFYCGNEPRFAINHPPMRR